MIAFFGTGLLGSGFVRALRKRGETVHVWNRTPSKARALEADGAVAFDDPAEAARGAARVHLTLSDDHAVDEVLERARAGHRAAAVVIVDHTTTSPPGTAAARRAGRERGIAFQHAPVFMGPQNALEGTGTCSPRATGALRRLSPELAKMTGKLDYLGPRPERAAAFKLMGNLFLMLMTRAWPRCSRSPRRSGSARRRGDAVRRLQPGHDDRRRMKRILEGDFAQPVVGARDGAQGRAAHVEEAARHAALAMLPAIAAEMDRWIARGHASDDWTVMAKESI